MRVQAREGGDNAIEGLASFCFSALASLSYSYLINTKRVLHLQTLRSSSRQGTRREEEEEWVPM